MTKSLGFYSILLFVFLAATGLALKAGENIEIRSDAAVGAAVETFNEAAAFSEKKPSPFLIILQLLVIIASAKTLGWIFKKIHQPAVMGEIVAGILLGPSVLGWIFPDLPNILFPPSTLGPLKILSQLGIVVFMFIVGMDLDTEFLKKKGHETLVVSHAGILFPFFLGVLVSLWLYPMYGAPGTAFRAFALFMGVAMSITAFPVLARILEERNMTKTPLGTLVIACAAVDDITAWCLLAGVIAVAAAQSMNTFFVTLILLAAYLTVMVFIVRPAVRKVTEKIALPAAFLILLAVAAVSAWVTEKIGIHALFGAFFAGVIAPNKMELQEFIRRKASVFLYLALPLFFALTGLRTEIGLINHPQAWGACFLIVLVAVMGKFGGSSLAARFLHMKWKDALSLGALMNTRGLMELIVLNIGYDLGILAPSVFTMMVVMALATTFMTGPLLSGIESAFTKRA